MASPAPAVSSPAASRTRDWVRSAEPGSAFNGIGRGGRGGGGRGRSRSGRGRNGPAGGTGGTSMSRSPSTSTSTSGVKSVAGEGGSNPKPAAPALSPVAEKSTNNAVTSPPPRSKGHAQRSSRSVPPTVPTVVIGPSSPSTETPAVPRPSNRRRRSQQLGSKGNGKPAAALQVNVAASLDDKLLRPQGRLVPHSAPPPSKDTPPHLVGSFDVRNNIDALVERVRAVAMDNRPSTPGSASHIDWAGDDDEGLPDLDDWGVTTSTSVTGKDEMISPIIVDGLKTLPEPTAKPPTPSGDAKDEAVVPFAMEEKPSQVAPPSLHPSLPAKPIVGPVPSVRASSKAVPIPVSGSQASSAPYGLEPTPGPVPSGRTSSKVESTPVSGPQASSARHGPEPTADQKPKEGQDAEAVSDSGREGLTASIHAPAASNSPSAPSNLISNPPTQPATFNPTHSRAQTLGRSFPQSAPVSFNPRFSHSGASTPQGRYFGNQHARTHSSPPAGSVLNNPRPLHSRPVITVDAISRLARTIAAPSARTPPISASNI